MSETIIKVENLSKRYRIGARQQSYRTFRETLVDAVKSPFLRLAKLSKNNLKRHQESEDLWALKNVFLKVNRGDILGIIGKNGAGKSTLLKILSRITEPTEGLVTIQGSVGSLLEVGTGFHPELTGHENLYLYGAILGMDRWEVTRKFDEIIDFAEMQKFIETPVKRYSSGMYMRLAFAVAAHLETDVLLVDEVLAVGDLAFQKKCMGKMETVAGQGRTVVFVSHNMGAIRHLCHYAVWMEQGEVVKMGEVGNVVRDYESASTKVTGNSWENPATANEKTEATLLRVVIADSEGRQRADFSSSENIYVIFTIRVNLPITALKLGFDLIKHGIVAFRSQNIDRKEALSVFNAGVHRLICVVPSGLLNVGEYSVIPSMSIHMVKGLFETNEAVVKFDVGIDTGRSSFHLVLNENNHPGIVFPILDWFRE